jgi:lipopolysaccharide assembly protein A
MRLIRSLIALCFVALGIVFGALNRDPVRVDLWFSAFQGRLGLVLLAVLLTGALLGGLVVTLGVVLPLRRTLARSGRDPGANPTRTPAP